ncbi:hypothetical protein B0O80DRAFT_21461 [Mortierella sp. GBAus27b]|nr:hypothetical protein B0O80DRAFT_21461 [Mortierella sp. GBAus27b]
MQGLCINTNGHPQQQQPTQPTPVSKQLPPLPGQSSPPIVAPNNLVLPHLGSQSSFSDELGSFLKPQSPPLVPAKDATQAVPGPTVTSPSSAASNAQVFFAFTESTVSDSVASGPQYLGNGSNVSAPPSAAPRTSLESASSGSLRASSSTHSTHPSHTSGYTHGTVVSSQAQPQSHGQDNGRSRGSTEGVAPHSTNPPQQPACGPSPVAQPTMTALPSQTSFAPLPSLPPTMHTPQQQYQPLSPQQQYQQPPPQLYHQSPQQQYQVPQYQQQYQQPVQQPYQQPYQQPVQQPYQQPMQYQQPVQPYQQPVQQPYQQPVQQPYQQPVQQPYQQPMQYQQQYQPYQQPVQQHPYQPQQPYQALPPQPVVPGVYSPPATQGMSPSNSTGSMNSIVSTTTSPPLPPAVRAPSPLAMADRSGLHPGRASMSSDDSRVQHLRSLHQSHLRAASVSGAGTARSPSPLSQPSKPLPAAKSEDWGALVDAPESPTQSFHNNGRFPSQRSFLMGPGYTDSPAEETVHSADYMQHVSQPPQQSQTLPYSAQPQQPKPTPRHAQTDPSPTQHRPSFHQHHNSQTRVQVTRWLGQDANHGLPTLNWKLLSP